MDMIGQEQTAWHVGNSARFACQLCGQTRDAQDENKASACGLDDALACVPDVPHGIQRVGRQEL